MAILKSSSGGELQKSSGDFTYRTVRGRTIVSRRIQTNKSNTVKQAARRNSFGCMARLCRTLKKVIDIGFEPVKYGAKHNNFIHSNTDLSNYLATHGNKEDDQYPLLYIHQALTDDRFFGHIYASKGNLNTACEFWLNEEGMPDGFISLSRDFEAKDTVILVYCITYTLGDNVVTYVDTDSTVLGSKDIALLPQPHQLRVSDRLFKDLNYREQLPHKAENICVAMSGIVTNGYERSTSLFVPVHT